jgi:hypothetical protein
MSGAKAFTYEVIRDVETRSPQIARVFFEDGDSKDFYFGHHVSEKRIIETLPKMVMDARKYNERKKAVNRGA